MDIMHKVTGLFEFEKCLFPLDFLICSDKIEMEDFIFSQQQLFFGILVFIEE